MLAWAGLILLLTLFLGLHTLPFRSGRRARLVEAVGGGAAYKALYTVLSIIGLFGAFSLASLAPSASLWTAGDLVRWLALVTTGVAFVLLGVAYGGGGTKLARHPMLAGMALWAGAHVLASGDLAHLFVFASVVAYSSWAMVASDRRLAATDADAFATVMSTTSYVPFWTAVRSGGIDGIRWRGPAVGLAIWLVFLLAHPWLFGVSPWPTAVS